MHWSNALHSIGVAWASIAGIRILDFYWPTQKPTGTAGYWLMGSLGFLMAILSVPFN